MKRYTFLFLMLFSFLTMAQDLPDNEVAGATDEDTPVTIPQMAGERSLTGSRAWRAPDFSNQEKALGWNESAFQIPKGMEAQVQFWTDIYSKYNTDQGVLHDSENIDLIYSKIDFTTITKRTDISEVKKQLLKEDLVKTEKKRVVEILRKLSKVTEPAELRGEEKTIWDAFQKIDEKNKFIEATSKSRMRFQLGLRDRMIQGIFFSGRYLEDFEKVFREAGLPMELTRLVFVESSFNVLARSKVGASGLWQIMRYTAKPYMMVNDAIDKRNHPMEATKLASKILKTNYKMLESWPLALTGYNHGPTGMLKLTKKFKTREIGELVQMYDIKKRFGFASRNFFACFLAALEVERNAPKYYGSVVWSQPLEASDIKIKTAIRYENLLKWFDGDEIKTQVFNPHITTAARKGKLNIPKSAVISVPKEKYDRVIADLTTLESLPPIKPPMIAVKTKKKKSRLAPKQATIQEANDSPL